VPLLWRLQAVLALVQDADNATEMAFGALGGSVTEASRVPSLMTAAVEREVYNSYFFYFFFDVSSMGHSA
jgi:hypothetical protein